MNRRFAVVLILFAFAAAGFPAARAGGVLCWLEAADQDGTLDAKVAELRAKGPAGLSEALKEYDALIAQVGQRNQELGSKGSKPNQDEADRGEAALEQMRQIIGQVAGQRDAHVSRLYWYTDLDAAKDAAADSGKPILSLRLLGKLTDEYSCANSRFFRTALYANRQVSDYLHDNYVLHWQSVRPVPCVTIDFGDGRTLKRTITGNSAHYVLDAVGRPLEALPGLYSPQAFQEWLVRSKDLADRLSPVFDGKSFDSLLVEHHANRRNIIDEQLHADLAQFAPELLNRDNSSDNPFATSSEAAATAHVAGRRSLSKRVQEEPILDAILPPTDQLQKQDDELWRRIAAAHAEDAQLDSASKVMFSLENPTAQQAGRRAASKGRIEDPMLRALMDFQRTMAVDTVKNEYTLHRQIHQWFVDRAIPDRIDAFNERVYADLFLTPSSDPWLGLAPPDVYTALDNGGRTAAE